MKRPYILYLILAYLSFVSYGEQGLHASNLELEYPASGGVLPVFGRNLSYVDVMSGEQRRISNRSVVDRLKDYFHPCVIREPAKTVYDNDIKKWKDNRYVRRPMKFSRPVQKQYMKKLSSYEDLIALVAAECYVYGLKPNFAQSVSIVNSFYSMDFHRKWEGLLRWKKYRNEFDRMFSQIDDALHDVLDLFDNVHKAEFEKWQQQNPLEYAAKQKALEDSAHNRALAIKMNRSIREAEAAKKEAQNATAAAKEAEKRARFAEEAARDAERAARDAEDAAVGARNATLYGW